MSVPCGTRVRQGSGSYQHHPCNGRKEGPVPFLPEQLWTCCTTSNASLAILPPSPQATQAPTQHHCTSPHPPPSKASVIASCQPMSDKSPRWPSSQSSTPSSARVRQALPHLPPPSSAAADHTWCLSHSTHQSSLSSSSPTSQFEALLLAGHHRPQSLTPLPDPRLAAPSPFSSSFELKQATPPCCTLAASLLPHRVHLQVLSGNWYKGE